MCIKAIQALLAVTRRTLDNLHDYVVLALVYSNCSSLGFIMDGLT